MGTLALRKYGIDLNDLFGVTLLQGIDLRNMAAGNLHVSA